MNEDVFVGLTLKELESEYHRRIESELTRLEGQSNLSKRRATIIGLAEADVRPDVNRTDVFNRRDTVSERIFYHKGKNWFHDQTFRSVLENVTTLTRFYHSARELAEIDEDRQKWRERMFRIADRAAGRLEEMIRFPLVETTIEDGKTIIKPAVWSWGNIPSIMRATDSVGRLALGMETEKTSTDITSGGETLNRPVIYLPDNGRDLVDEDGDSDE